VFFSFNDGPSLIAAAARLSSGKVTNAKADRTPLGVVLDGINSTFVDLGKSFLISDSSTFSGN
jgi:hypothetical protein